jgi:hypothetical protein
MRLLDLPTEIMTLIFAQTDAKTLLHLCLVGNHRVLDIARCLLFQNIRWAWDGEKLYSHYDDGPRAKFVEIMNESTSVDQIIDEQQASFNRLCEDEKLQPAVVAVRCIKFSVYNRFNPSSLSRSFFLNLRKFTSVRYLSISFLGSRSDNYDVGVTIRAMLDILGPKLKSLHLEGCVEGTNCQKLEDLSKIRLPSLQHLSLFFCSPRFSDVWKYNPSILNVEYKASSALQYWQVKIGSLGVERESSHTPPYVLFPTTSHSLEAMQRMTLRMPREIISGSTRHCTTTVDFSRISSDYPFTVTMFMTA